MSEPASGGGAVDAARFVIAEAAGPADIAAVRMLFLDYAGSLGFSLCFQGFDDELASLPGKYGPPGGRLLLARDDSGAAVGVVGVRPLGDGVCEMKRLYVVPAARGGHLGRRLAEAAIAAGDAMGYAAMRLDTHTQFTRAIALYRALGFVEIAAYYRNPLPGVVYFELGFDRAAPSGHPKVGTAGRHAGADESVAGCRPRICTN